MNPNGKYFKYPRPCLTISRKERKRLDKFGHCLVTFPASIEYNGGIILTPDGKMDINCRHPKSKWYNGIKVPSPYVPKGYELKPYSCGLFLNACPPHATMILAKKEKKGKKPCQSNVN